MTDQITSREGFIRLALVAPFVGYLRLRGVSVDDAIAQMGLSDAALRDPERFVHAEVVYGLLNALARVSDDRYLGLHVGEYQDLSQWPPFVGNLAQADTLGAFWAGHIERVPKEANSVSHHLSVDADGACYEVLRHHEPHETPEQTVGFAAGIYARLFQRLCGDLWDGAQVTLESRHLDGVPKGYLGM